MSQLPNNDEEVDRLLAEAGLLTEYKRDHTKDEDFNILVHYKIALLHANTINDLFDLKDDVIHTINSNKAFVKRVNKISKNKIGNEYRVKLFDEQNLRLTALLGMIRPKGQKLS